jgi:uncharacterized protein (DUF58 family)
MRTIFCYQLLASALFISLATPVSAATPRVTVKQVLSSKRTLEDKVIAVEGFVRFDRLSQRGFLYKDLADLKNRNYRQTVFLELGNENYSSLKIPDGSYVVVLGYLSAELRGPLGVYAGHIIVDRIQILRESQKRK